MRDELLEAAKNVACNCDELCERDDTQNRADCRFGRLADEIWIYEQSLLTPKEDEK